MNKMDKKALLDYALFARKSLEEQIALSLNRIGIFKDKIARANIVGDFTIIEGINENFPKRIYNLREEIINNHIKENSFDSVVEEFAYTWFNRIIALRFMEVHGYFSHGFRVLTSPDGSAEPEILSNLNYVKDELKLDGSVIEEYRNSGNTEGLYRYVLFAQCNALSKSLPMLFDTQYSYMELFLPNNLLSKNSVIGKITEIPEEDFKNDVEVIGWLYQYYVQSNREEFRKAKVVTKNLIPTLSQVFTPDWIVRYMAENSVGRIWLESNPSSPLKSEMKYYVDDAKQEENVQKQLDSIKYKNVDLEKIKIIEPCCGSGHILVYIFDLLFKMYSEIGYAPNEIPALILKNNLFGLDIDKRAAQLSQFALMMKARAYDRKFFSPSRIVFPKVYEIKDSSALINTKYADFVKRIGFSKEQIETINYLVDTFQYAKTIGSLLKVKQLDYRELKEKTENIKKDFIPNILETEFVNHGLSNLIELCEQAQIMSNQYDVMITNPPYLGISKLELQPKGYLIRNYPDSKSDMFGMFMEAPYVKKNGFLAMVNPDSWMFLVSFEQLRKKIIKNESIVNMIHLGLGAFDATVQTTSFVIRNSPIATNGVYFRLVDEKDKETAFLAGGGITMNISCYNSIPGNSFAYWAGSLFEVFEKNKSLSTKSIAKAGLSTGNNDLYLRLWYEVNNCEIGFDLNDNQDFLKSNKEYVPCNKGGEFRRWYGNNDYVVDWKRSDEFHRPRTTYLNYYYKPGLTWTVLTTGKFCVRYYGKGFLFDHAAASLFSNDSNDELSFIAYMNTKVADFILNLINPTLNAGADVILRMPFIELDMFQKCVVSNLASENIQKCIQDWDSFETSWDFKKHPLI